ncbi:threonine aldolase family protein [Crateriforma conspicua]|uniref:threonine aldolase family protein n=1 Tax=Crateriforma conspicua TaxID=2527996 RepID=UPI0011888CB5|nr:GntG family PLP-dependent aldolase [Crateriforma conspicua]QDV65496.1 L-allo-threonine aldolase [Crateriforma conspicua]
MIDLRSDTLTKPTAAMRQAMATAEVGDAVIDTDPTVEHLERFTAELLGKEDAVFMPSGSMSNQIGIRIHCERGTEFLCETEAHIYQYEQGAFAQLSGLVAHPIAGENGVLRVADVQDQIRPETDYMVRTALLCLENTHNRWGGRVLPHDETIALCDWAAENGLRRHLDGARLWNASVAKGISLGDLAAPFDTVSVCYSKGLGAPVGSALVGPRDLMDQARRARKLFGGAMRQVGIVAAGALYALQHHRDRLINDHEAARKLAVAACRSPMIRARGDRVETNLVVLDVHPDWGTAQQFCEKLEQAGVRSFTFGKQAIRLVTHLDVSPEQIDRACKILVEVADDPVADTADAAQDG